MGFGLLCRFPGPFHVRACRQWRRRACARIALARRVRPRSRTRVGGPPSGAAPLAKSLPHGGFGSPL
eukprot:14464354-Alexandrium_andersonii.AAC.1